MPKKDSVPFVIVVKLVSFLQRWNRKCNGSKILELNHLSGQTIFTVPELNQVVVAVSNSSIIRHLNMILNKWPCRQQSGKQHN